jgi:hypothetical protein
MPASYESVLVAILPPTLQIVALEEFLGVYDGYVRGT